MQVKFLNKCKIALLSENGTIKLLGVGGPSLLRYSGFREGTVVLLRFKLQVLTRPSL